ncbi:CbiX/SirB N-terminal domain-containing protein [Curvibacter sp. CHRR-16]|uniref:sirohydrochlorin chelatase n=1 Tax=Curvibacter sp. CHRR-16 TaxID=2835872 RepID=UPI001BDAE9BE|nr:CbiX/SirB N-terminal domain-containing protein [Curvibacter sp. CHRR-16]MBT0571232.1 CbiX/SirB N-terminal domain-containing protein [Curvibacter sp. CHRR-16]
MAFEHEQAIVLLAHGSRDPAWHQSILAVQACIEAQAPNLQVACAYLELSSPELAQAVADLVQCNARHIAILPLFLGMGKHAREDIPPLVESLRTQYPQVRFTLQASVGESPQLIALLAQLALTPFQP